MSSGDYLRFLRGRKGGPDLATVSAASGVPNSLLREIEQRYRRVGDAEALTRLAAYYEVPPEELLWRHEWPRKGLTAALYAAQRDHTPIRLFLRTGQTLEGKVVWWDLGATLIETEDGQQKVVQRHMVDRWDPRVEWEEEDEESQSAKGRMSEESESAKGRMSEESESASGRMSEESESANGRESEGANQREG